MTSIQEKYLKILSETCLRDIEVVTAKMKDYSQDSDPFSNFRFAAQAAGISVDQVFLVMEAVKLSRLENLLNTGKEPQNEAVTDTMGDLARYARIHEAYHKLKNTDDPSYLYSAAGDDLSQEGVPNNSEAEEPAPAAESASDKLLSFLRLK